MGECTMLETKWNPTTLNRLLTDANRHLRDVDEQTLRAGNHHLLHIILLQVFPGFAFNRSCVASLMIWATFCLRSDIVCEI